MGVPWDRDGSVLGQRWVCLRTEMGVSKDRDESVLGQR